jgi:arylsulfatase A-like enzyme
LIKTVSIKLKLMNKLLQLFFVFFCAFSLSAQQKPNVVFVLADDLGWGDISYNNKDPEWFRHTPKIDEICEKGIYFRNYTAHHVCSPTRAGLMTGLHYTKVGSGSETGGTLHNDIPNVAKDFQANGYVTGAFGKWHNGFPNFPIDGNGASVSRVSDIDSSNNIFEKKEGQEWGEGVNAYGFDKWTGYYNGGGDYFNRYVNAHHEYDWWIDQHYRPDVDGYTTDLIGEAAVAFIEDSKDKPFYCYVPMEAVHAPYHVKLSDLEELCSFFPGEWDYIKDIASPTTGRKISEVAEIRCSPGSEFDHVAIDPSGTHFIRLIYSTMVYSMDKAIGSIIEKLEEHDLLDNTIIFFSSDNGATEQGSNGIFRGNKHSLWEGGIHLPSALWWPGKIDAVTLSAYAAGDNVYDGHVQYIDYYPTIMSLTNSTISATNLDGVDFSDGLLNRYDVREKHESPYFGINTQWGVVKSDKWKLHYNEVPDLQILELYDIENDPGETENLVSAEPEVTEELKQLYNDWVDENNYAFSYLPVPMEKIAEPDPAPEGAVLEVEAWQRDSLVEPFHVRFSNFSQGGKEPGDRFEFDIFVPADSDQDSGFLFTPGGGVRPYLINNNGVNQDTVSMLGVKWPRNKWVRNVVGYGNHVPIGGYANYVTFHGTDPGYIHFYLDNIVCRRSDGTTYTIWKDGDDFDNIRYRYQDKQYTSFSDVEKADGFSFYDVKLSAVPLSEVPMPSLVLDKPIEDIVLEDWLSISLDEMFRINDNPAALIPKSLDDWTNKDKLNVVYDPESDQVILERLDNEGGESVVSITAYYQEESLTTTFKVTMPSYSLEIKDSIDDISLMDTMVSVPLDEVFEVTNKDDAEISIELVSWTVPELLDVSYVQEANSLILERKGAEGGESVVELMASWNGEEISTTFNVEIIQLVADILQSAQSEIKIYPNPASNRVFIQVEEDCDINIYNSSGMLVCSRVNPESISLTAFKSGIYFVKIKTGTYSVIKKLQVINP